MLHNHPPFLLVIYLTVIQLPDGDAVCYDTTFMEERYTSLTLSDRQIKHVRKEGYCKTHCAANSSCAAYSYNTETSTCYLSSEAKVVMSDETGKSASVKMSFKSKLRIEYDNTTPLPTTTTEANTIPTTTTEATIIPTTTTEATTILTITTEAPETATEACPEGRDASGNCYFFIKIPNSWSNSRDLCKKKNAKADLAVLSDPEKHQALQTMLQREGIPSRYIWVGGNQTEKATQSYMWLDGTTIPIDDADFWETDEPDGFTSSYNQCLVIKAISDTSIQGYDKTCTGEHWAVCEL